MDLPEKTSPSPSIENAMLAFLRMVQSSRSQNTYKTYRFAMDYLAKVLADHKLPPTLPASGISEEVILWLLAELQNASVATERLYVSAANGFFEYLVDEELAPLNLARIRSLARKRTRRPGVRLPQFPRQAIESVCEYYHNKTLFPPEEPDQLIYLRDRAFLITLADTGLRVHEACGLTRGIMDWNEGKAMIIGKGNKEAVVRFSRRSLRAIKDYLAARSRLDGASGRPLSSLPIFARHDRGAGKKVKAMTTKTGREIVDARVHQALGDDEEAAQITPHSFRHYFVTVVLRGTGNMKLAQELARHSSISTTQRYAHLSNDELDAGYEQVFE